MTCFGLDVPDTPSYGAKLPLLQSNKLRLFRGLFKDKFPSPAMPPVIVDLAIK
jgi:hypothetical protein